MLKRVSFVSFFRLQPGSTTALSAEIPPSARRFRFVIYGLTVLMSAICYADRAALSVAMPTIAKTFNLTPVEIGWTLSSFLWSYFILNLPAAMLIDRFGARIVGASAVALWSVAMAFGGMVSSLPAFLLTRILLGAGEAPTFPLGNKIVRIWAPLRERGIVLTALICGLPIGLAGGAAAGSWLIASYGWRMAFLVLGGIGLIWSALWLLCYPASNMFEHDRTRAILNVRGIFRARSFWGIVGGQCCANYANYLLMSWLPIILGNVLHLDIVQAGVSTAVCYIASAALALALGRLGERYVRGKDLSTGARRRVVGSCFLIAGTMGLLPLCTTASTVMPLLVIAMAFLSAGIGANMALLSDLIVENELVASTTGLSFTFSNGVGILAPVLTGYLLQATGNFHGVFYLTSGILMLGVVMIWTLPRRTFHARVQSSS